MANLMKRPAANNVPAAAPRSLSGFMETFFPTSLNRLFDDDFWGFNGGMTTGSQAPAVNIRETGKTYELDLIAPGLKKEDFRVSVDNNMLTISFEHREEQKEEDKDSKMLRHEYRHQSFQRSFSLDDKVDANGISARYADGILHLTVPKKPEAQRMTRAIEVE